MENEVVIRMEHLNCLSGSKYLLNNINWKVQRGEQWVVFGRNGCGKTTLLSIIGGYQRYASGVLEINGEEITEENVLSVRKKIGWISSSFFDKYYHKELVIDIVLAGLSGTLGKPIAVRNGEIRKAKELLERLGIGHKADMPFDMLSKGERQHVLIARAFMTTPEILILDEPGTGLDVLARERLLKTVQELAQDHRVTLIYVTHYVEEILPSFTKCMLLRNGAVYKIGETKELLRSEVMSDFFDYAVNIREQNGRYFFETAYEKEHEELRDLIGKAGYDAGV